jgi:hypothetical protein
MPIRLRKQSKRRLRSRSRRRSRRRSRSRRLRGGVNKTLANAGMIMSLHEAGLPYDSIASINSVMLLEIPRQDFNILDANYREFAKSLKVVQNDINQLRKKNMDIFKSSGHTDPNVVHLIKDLKAALKALSISLTKTTKQLNGYVYE